MRAPWSFASSNTNHDDVRKHWASTALAYALTLRRARRTRSLNSAHQPARRARGPATRARVFHPFGVRDPAPFASRSRTTNVVAPRARGRRRRLLRGRQARALLPRVGRPRQPRAQAGRVAHAGALVCLVGIKLRDAAPRVGLAKHSLGAHGARALRLRAVRLLAPRPRRARNATPMTQRAPCPSPAPAAPATATQRPNPTHQPNFAPPLQPYLQGTTCRRPARRRARRSRAPFSRRAFRCGSARPLRTRPSGT